uniref:Uncharacterized protein n=1 Tax=Odontella aurita TaxID=265563 RepID=A0A7S4IPX6_9STRA|mmetsp:Transcript_2839/g.7484  ORF Transcript_2839/g.7484 Transcript_2839/m.7484 type:complete len:296 (+) Transcript_2839:279-1166(+)|eukprot:CAMPEP_0113546812 /NCGR_PEP_ID=MMETSP0015_2-20120614/12008_1 /TAXON_ID=2838 /ORGANISM="Odontella" /LENGTH=295 /DNA_ID=CAMNT_0000447297 /DNA_START=215 /DNA_END=1102 /DNA_ORIENTATION=+ /assembly_acc=CAM_ASM_000160
MDCTSLMDPLPHHPANGDELAMLDCFDPDDPEMSEFLVGGVGEFSDTVDVVALDLPPLSETSSAQHEDVETTAEQDALLEPPFLPLVSDDASMCSAAPPSQTSDDASMCSAASAASGAKRPRRRSLTHAPPPPRSKPRQQQAPQQHRRQQQHPRLQRACSTLVNGGSSSGNGNNGEYNAMLTKLAASMKRSEMSRANVMRQRQSLQNRPTPTPVASSSSMGMASPAQQRASVTSTSASAAQQQQQQQQRSVPHFQSMIGLSGFLNGQRSTLTSGLEQSRMQLKAYMTQVNRLNSM